MKTLSASEIATLLCGPQNGTQESQAIGEVVHEALSYDRYVGNQVWMQHVAPLHRRIAAELQKRGFKTSTIQRAIRIASTLGPHISGLTPKTRSFVLDRNEGIAVAVKPDFIDRVDESIIEMKTCELNDFARAQAGVFALAYNKPVNLLGVRELPTGRFELQRETIGPIDPRIIMPLVLEHGMEQSSLPEEIGTEHYRLPSYTSYHDWNENGGDDDKY